MRTGGKKDEERDKKDCQYNRNTLSVELMTYQGGTNGAREYVVAQAKQACDSINQEVYIENLTSETTWRGGRAELTFACVDKSDSRLKQ